jgi:glucan phosphoethanolaminetransferase (alkaline phosphatase superfamily)
VTSNWLLDKNTQRATASVKPAMALVKTVVGWLLFVHFFIFLRFLCLRRIRFLAHLSRILVSNNNLFSQTLLIHFKSINQNKSSSDPNSFPVYATGTANFCKSFATYDINASVLAFTVHARLPPTFTRVCKSTSPSFAAAITSTSMISITWNPRIDWIASEYFCGVVRAGAVSSAEP